jgi:hypothetical protein
MLDIVSEFLKQDFTPLILLVFILMSGVIAMHKIIGDFSKIIKRPVSWVKKKDLDHELLIKVTNDLKELHDKQEKDTKQSIRHDEVIRNDLRKLTDTVDGIAHKIETMQAKIDSTEMAKLKEKILAYYRKYSPLGEWEQFESDVFWGLYDSYISHGGNSFVKDDIEPVMRKLKIKE